MNVIEPYWYWMKREITKNRLITSEKELKEAWIKYQEDMSEEKIQVQIKRILVHIKEIIRLKGENKYSKGRNKGKEKVRVYN